ncbi:hypothetical protein Ciccas_007939 [Cichlidogyrus casuarinus]|uniref:C2H2-type domain-containing protein n=1 Tax=Cichlidogyrus casuarinus TaxID=1844966 RepID=A0ABD2Q1V0_9PLAT
MPAPSERKAFVPTGGKSDFIAVTISSNHQQQQPTLLPKSNNQQLDNQENGGKGLSALYCKGCARSFKSRCDLEKHTKSKHHVDTNCSAKTVDQESKDEQLQEFLSSEKIKCDVCQQLRKRSQYEAHRNTHYIQQSSAPSNGVEKSLSLGNCTRQFRCEACNVGFQSKGTLERHLRSKIHHNTLQTSKKDSPLHSAAASPCDR